MKSAGEIMEILEAYDLVGTYRGAARLAGCDHHTVQRYVERRETAAEPAVPTSRPSMIDGYRAKIEELVERSEGEVRAPICGCCANTAKHDRRYGLATSTSLPLIWRRGTRSQERSDAGQEARRDRLGRV